MYARQFAHVFQGKVLGRELIRLAVPEEHMHRPVIIHFAGLISLMMYFSFKWEPSFCLDFC